MVAGAIGKEGFVERHGLWSAEQTEAAKKVIKLAAQENVEIVRLSFADQHGILRGKSIVPDELASAMANGVTMVTTLLAKDTAGRTVYASFTPGGGFGIPEMSGAGDFVMVPDPLTFRVLPWAPDTGWMLCDIYFTNGKPVPFSTRQIGRDALAALAERGYDYLCGLEIEFHVFRLDDASLKGQGCGNALEGRDVDADVSEEAGQRFQRGPVGYPVMASASGQIGDRAGEDAA